MPSKSRQRSVVAACPLRRRGQPASLIAIGSLLSHSPAPPTFCEIQLRDCLKTSTKTHSRFQSLTADRFMPSLQAVVRLTAWGLPPTTADVALCGSAALQADWNVAKKNTKITARTYAHAMTESRNE